MPLDVGQFIGKGPAELLAPLANRFVGDEHSASHYHLLNVAITEAEAEIEPHTVTDDLYREAVAAVQRNEGAHTVFIHHTLPRASMRCKVDNTVSAQYWELDTPQWPGGVGGKGGL